MSGYSSSRVKITTFVNPHLFWFFEADSAKERLELETGLGSVDHEAESAPCVDQLVLVYDSVWKRATIKEVDDEVFRCWLIDYGVFHTCNRVYVLPKQFSAKPALVKQGALHKIVGITSKLNGVDGWQPVKTIEFNIGAIKCSKEHIGDARNIFFRRSAEKDGIQVGEINILGNNGQLFDLTSALLAQGNCVIDEDMFNEALEANSNLDQKSIFSEMRSPSPQGPNHIKTIMDLAGSKGLGRGDTSRTLGKERLLSPGSQEELKKIQFVEKWVERTRSSQPFDSDSLKYESDEEANNRSSEQDVETASTSNSMTDMETFTPPKPNRSPISLLHIMNRKIERQKKDSADTSCEAQAPGGSPGDGTRAQLLLQRLRNMQTERNRLSADNEASPGSEDKLIDISTDSNKSGPSVANSGGSVRLQRMLKLSGNKSTDATQPIVFDCDSKIKALDQKPICNDRGEFRPWGEKSDDRLLNMCPAGMRNMSLADSKAKPRQKRRVSFELPERELDKSSRRSNAGSSGTNSILSKHRECIKGNPSNENDGPSDRPIFKPQCDCSQCLEWDTNETMIDNTGGDHKPHRKPTKGFTKPPLLLKTKTTENEVDILTHVSVLGKTAQTEHTITGRILVHGISLPVPVTTPTAVAFHSDVHRAVDKLTEAYTIQSYVWPALMRQSNVCMVHTAKSGKTLAYLPAVCSYLLEREDRYKKLPPNTMSPLAIILCPNSKTAEDVNQLMDVLMNSPYKPVKVLAVPPLDKKCLNQFQKPCDALVTTPLVLTSLLTAKLINMKRLCHLVIEGADVILQRFFSQLQHLLNLCQQMLDHRVCVHKVQLVMTAETWTVRLDSLVKRMNEAPLVCVGSHLEAAMYGRVNIEMKFFKSNTKTYTLGCLLKEKDGIGKTVVICGTDAQVKETEVVFQTNGVTAIFIYEAMHKGQVREMEKNWHHDGGALICTDHTYNLHLNISSAVLLVHYSLPDTWTQFAHRFGCMLDNYVSPVTTKLAHNQTRCNTHIFVDESNTKQIPKLIQLLLRLGVELPSKFFNYYKATVKDRELAKLRVKKQLCPNLQLLGKCVADNRQLCYTTAESDIACLSLNCDNRHIVSADVDCSSLLPTCGTVKFRILRVRDVSSFTVKLLEHTDPDGTVHQWAQDETLDGDLQEAMAQNKIGIYDAQLWSRYVVETKDHNKYSRCVVHKIVERDRITEKPTVVAVRLLESGVETTVATSYLYELPEKFRDSAPQGVDVYLANVTPPEGDESWSSYSRSLVKDLLLRAGCKNENVYAVGQIMLQLNGIIWVENALLVEKLETCNLTVTKLNLRKALKDQGLIAYSEQQLEGLYGLCEKGGIALPDYSKKPPSVYKVGKLQEQVEPQWAFFDNAECNAVYISALFTPDLFYLRLKKFNDLFEALQKEIQEAICGPFYPKYFELVIGNNYLVRDPGSDDYSRAKLTGIREGLADCFFVDFGDSASVNVADIKYLPNEMITKLPFQAIECRLYGVKCAGDDWDLATSDVLSEYIFEPGTDYYLTLYATTCKEEPASTTGGQKCAILLIDYCKNKTTLINQLMISCGQAVEAEGEDLGDQFVALEEYVEPPDEFVDDYDEEITFTELKEIRSRHGIDDTNNNDVGNNDDVNCDSDENHWDIQINDAHKFMQELCGIKIPNVRPISTDRELLPMTAVPSVSHCTPEVVWYQTPTHVKLSINIPDVTNYFLQVIRNRILTFRTTHKETQYKLNLNLFEKVEKTFQDSPFGTHLHVTLTKTTAVDWPRLVLTTKRMRNIKYDLNHCVEPETKKKPYLTLGSCKEDIIDGVYIESGSDDSDSDPESVASN